MKLATTICFLLVSGIGNLTFPAAAAMPPRVTKTPVHFGYLYPAGGQRGTTFEVAVGGENIYGTTAAFISGTGVTAIVTGANEADATAGTTAISEVLTLEITIAPDAALNTRDIFLLAPGGVSNKLFFQVADLEEFTETEPNGKSTPNQLTVLPATINGQIMPGDTDLFEFSAKRGQHLVAEVSVRALIPYIADAVPGWFQATVSMQDRQGKEVALADSFRFSQDPMLFFDVPADGEYTLAIRDSIYRGREDFVYRIRLGELPYITDVFPLGAREGRPHTVRIYGKNLPGDSDDVLVRGDLPGTHQFSVSRTGGTSNSVPFAVDNLPEIVAKGVATSASKPLNITPPIIINGIIDRPGKVDHFSFSGYKGQAIFTEVMARRLGSPLDSFLVLTDGHGNLIAENDDAKTQGSGVATHQADSAIDFTLPADGSYTIAIFDTQGHGDLAYAYRLYISSPMPNFRLRMVPAAVSVPRGGSTPVTVYVIRQGGFAGEIRLALDNPAPGLSLDGATIPAGADQVRLTISAAPTARAGMVPIKLRGTAVVNGKEIDSGVDPAEIVTQAFNLPSWVPFAEEQIVITALAAPFTVALQLPASGALQLPLGEVTSVPVTAARQPGYDGPIRIQLEHAPAGVTVRDGIIPAGEDRSQVTLRVAGDIDPKLSGNLVFSGIMSAGVETRPEEIVIVPAVPFRLASAQFRRGF